MVYYCPGIMQLLEAGNLTVNKRESNYKDLNTV